MATFADEDAILKRRDDVWKRRVKGDTIREIAKELGVSVGTVQSDLNAVRLELDHDNKVRAEIERSVGAGRLDAAAKKLLAIINIKDSELAGAEPEQLISLATAIPAAINALARIEERRAKLLGLDAPTKTEVSGADGGPLQVADARNALLAKLSSLAAGESASGEAAEDTDTAES
jgi:DNA-binding CsgD family transcriptional regulator